jgi:putative transposase
VNCSTNEKRKCIETEHEKLTIEKQCELVGISRSGYYYEPEIASKKTLSLVNIVDETYTRYPFFGTRKMASYLKRNGYEIGRKRVKTIYEI